MTTRSYTIADIDRAIVAENERHKRAIQKLNDARETFAELDDLIPASSGLGRLRPSDKIEFNPEEYGGKKRLLLRLIAAENDGLGSGEVIAAAQNAGLSDARPENVTPQLSTYKSEGLLIMNGTNWCITQKGRDFLAHKN